jgi:hypothetical protein
VTAYDASQWADFSVAVLGGAAALVGLVFLAVSINLRQILSFPHLPGRAGQTLVLFTMPLWIAILLLVPGQSRAALSTELLIAAVVTSGFQAWITRGSRSEQETPLTWLVGRIFPAIVTGGFLVLAAATLLAQAGGGLYWVVPSVLASFVFGLVNAWVLLVEIMR